MVKVRLGLNSVSRQPLDFNYNTGSSLGLQTASPACRFHNHASQFLKINQSINQSTSLHTRTLTHPIGFACMENHKRDYLLLIYSVILIMFLNLFKPISHL